MPPPRTLETAEEGPALNRVKTDFVYLLHIKWKKSDAYNQKLPESAIPKLLAEGDRKYRHHQKHVLLPSDNLLRQKANAESLKLELKGCPKLLAE